MFEEIEEWIAQVESRMAKLEAVGNKKDTDGVEIAKIVVENDDGEIINPFVRSTEDEIKDMASSLFYSKLQGGLDTWESGDHLDYAQKCIQAANAFHTAWSIFKEEGKRA
jgi:hypothetical protein